MMAIVKLKTVAFRIISLKMIVTSMIYSCLVGISIGILGSTLSYALWKTFVEKDKQVNKIEPKIVTNDILTITFSVL
jgi:hypothetical protein